SVDGHLFFFFYSFYLKYLVKGVMGEYPGSFRGSSPRRKNKVYLDISPNWLYDWDVNGNDCPFHHDTSSRGTISFIGLACSISVKCFTCYIRLMDSQRD